MNIANLLPNNLSEYWVYVVNVSYDLDEENIRNFFSRCGQVVGFAFVYDRNGIKKGHVRIAYRKKSEALRAIAELHNSRYNGRGIKLNWDKGMVIKNTTASSEKITELLKKSEYDRSISYSLYNENTEIDPENYINQNQTPYKKTLGNTIDRSQTNPYELLYTKQMDSQNFPFIIPKNS